MYDEKNLLNDETIEKLLNDMKNDKNFMNNFLLNDISENENNLFFSNVAEIKNDFFKLITGWKNYTSFYFDDFIYDFIGGMKSYDILFGNNCYKKPLFSIYIPCDNDENFIFVNENTYNCKKIVIYFSQGGLNNVEFYKQFDITNINNYETLLNVIKEKIIEIY